MSEIVSTVNSNTDTFASWITVTNTLAQTVSNSVITANTTEGVTGNSTVSLNAKLLGTFKANTISINNTLASAQTGANVTVQANLSIDTGYKLYTTGELNVKGNFVVDTTSKLRFTDRSTTYSATTGWLKANSTGYMAFANLAVKSTDLDPTEFTLTANIGYANSTTSNSDIIVYDSTSGKWLRTTLSHLITQEVDNLTLGNLRANSAVGEIRVNGNTNFGGSISSLFVANTNARVGIGGITNPLAPLHVNGAIYATGDVTAYYTSDKNLKLNIITIDDALHKIKQLNGVTFEWDKEKIKLLNNVGPKPDHDLGLIAQEVEKVCPQAVTLRDDGFKAVDYNKLVPVLIEAIKELSSKVNTLESHIDQVRIGSSW